MEEQVEKYIDNKIEISYMFQNVEKLILALTNIIQMREALLATAKIMKNQLVKCDGLTPEQTQQCFTFNELYNRLNDKREII